jgi:hypothetical protein
MSPFLCAEVFLVADAGILGEPQEDHVTVTRFLFLEIIFYIVENSIYL